MTLNEESAFQGSEGELILYKEFLSHSLDFKSTILKKNKSEEYCIYVYAWRSGATSDEHSDSFWERIYGPISLENAEMSQKIALEQLRIFSGELIDGRKTAKDIERLREISGDENAEYLAPLSFPVKQYVQGKTGEEKIPVSATTLVIANDLFYIEHGKNWSIGTQDDEKTIHCFRSYSSLEEAIHDVHKADCSCS